MIETKSRTKWMILIPTYTDFALSVQVYIINCHREKKLIQFENVEEKLKQ